MTDTDVMDDTNICVANLMASNCVFCSYGSERSSKAFSGGDALRGHTRSHPEHDG